MGPINALLIIPGIIYQVLYNQFHLHIAHSAPAPLLSGSRLRCVTIKSIYSVANSVRILVLLRFRVLQSKHRKINQDET